MLAEATQAVASSIVIALQKASAATGSDFHYLLGTAIRESGLKPQAHSASSSGSGLFQFVEQTWYGLVKDYGAKHGLGSYASAITRGADGRYRADNAADRRAILALRNDPQVSALMAGEYAHQTQTEMQSALGRPVCGGELYAAHFLGADAACRLIEMNGRAPDAVAANAFPQAAGANKSVFYHSDGTPKTVREVYDWAVDRPSVTAPIAVASTTPIAPPVSPASTASAIAGTEDYSAVLASMWSPSGRGFFSTGDGASPFLLTPDILEVLSSNAAKEPGAT
jgi:hypothetical protein